AILVAHLAHLLANRVAAVAAAGLVDRLAHGLAHLLAVGLISRLVDRVMALFQYRAVDGAANGAVLGAPLGFPALPVASSLFGAVAGLANRAHDGLANGLMAHMEPLFGDGVPDQLVTGASLLLAGVETALSVAGRLSEDAEAGATTVGGLRHGAGP